MKKKILGALLGALLVSGNCFAMTFSTPEKIGTVANYGRPDEVRVAGAAASDGEEVSGGKGEPVYRKVTARFGEGDDALYYHYDAGIEQGETGKRQVTSLFGGQTKKNAFFVSPYHCWVYRLLADGKKPFYVLQDARRNYLIVGRKEDRFVKYIDTRALTKKYFPRRHVIYKNLRAQGDTVILEYHIERGIQGYDDKVGELRFQWDDEAERFDVKRVNSDARKGK